MIASNIHESQCANCRQWIETSLLVPYNDYPDLLLCHDCLIICAQNGSSVHLSAMIHFLEVIEANRIDPLNGIDGKN